MCAMKCIHYDLWNDVFCNKEETIFGVDASIFDFFAKGKRT